jgi:hypothetical protein
MSRARDIANLQSSKITADAGIDIDNITLEDNDISTTNSNGNLTITPNGTGDLYVNSDRLAVKAANDESATVLLGADNQDDAGDTWKITAQADHTLVFQNDKSGSSDVTHFSITPNATVTSSTATFAGGVDAATFFRANNFYTGVGSQGFVNVDTNNCKIVSQSGDVHMYFTNDGSAYMYYNAAEKIKTTSTGVTVTGTTQIGTDVGSYTVSDFSMFVSNADQGTTICLYDDQSNYHSALIDYDSNVLTLALNNSNSANTLLTTSAINLTKDGVGIGTTPNDWNLGTSGRTPIQIGYGSFSGRLNDMNTESSPNFSWTDRLVIDLTGNIFIRTGNLQFGASGSETGQIEINSTRLLLRSTGDASGIRFDASAYTPFKNGSAADGTVDLGFSAGRYKDLYLSGGLLIGGTGSANTLDDYEEGTWTIADNSGASLSLTQYVAEYTKIGNKVFFEIGIVFPSTSDTNDINLSLPFTAKSTSDNTGGAAMTTTTSNRTDTLVVVRGQARLSLSTLANAGVTNVSYSGHQIRCAGLYTVA